jgi:hypothetical protein
VKKKGGTIRKINLASSNVQKTFGWAGGCSSVVGNKSGICKDLDSIRISKKTVLNWITTLPEI